MTDRRIFTFWEPKDRIVPYLELCLKTWEKNLGDYAIVVLDYSNIDDYIPKGTLDLASLRRLSLPMQKDAVSAAVLVQHGGVFMDVDTLVFRDLSPILRLLANSELVMFGTHLGFLAARPGSMVLTLWLARIREKLAKLAAANGAQVELPWDYVGNSALSAAMDDLINRPAFNRMQTQAVDTLARFVNGHPAAGPGVKRIVNRVHASFVGRRRRLAFDTVYRRHLAALDRVKSGFIVEAKYYAAGSKQPRETRLGPEAMYRKFWFEDDVDVDAVIQTDPIIAGLHHSWTPQWYQEFSRQAVLENGCLLSKTLRYLLAN